MEAKPEVGWVGTMSQRVAMLALTTRNVSTEKQNLAHTLLTHFASRLDSLAFLLKEMQRDAEVRFANYVKLENGKLEEEVAIMENFLDSHADKCNLYLLGSCPQISKQIQTSSKHISEALNAVLHNSGNVGMKLRMTHVKEAFEKVGPKLDAKQHSILDSLEPEMLDSVVADSARSSKLVQQIAESFELTVDSDQFVKELKRLKTDQERVENAKEKAQALYLEQFVTLLEKGVAVKSKPVMKLGESPAPLVRKLTMRSIPFSPLQSFICPITQDVMRDPVQIASGQTYEREAIERWFVEGYTRCPMGVELKNTKMKSNIALRQSIAEWRERNYDIRIQIAEENLKSGLIDDQEKAVQELQRICEEENMNKYCIASKGLLIPLVRLAEIKSIHLRSKTLAALLILAEDNDENQEIMVKEGIIEILVRCLARSYGESEQAVLLLLLLSSKENLAEKISHSHGAVLLLVTLLGSEHGDMAANVKKILQNLPSSDENIVIMAEANFMNPLVNRLTQGSRTSKINMAKTLGQLQMPETSKIQAATEESISILLCMARSGDEDEKLSALEALNNLTTVRRVCVMLAQAKPNPLETFVPLLNAPKTTMAVRIVAACVMANVMTCLADEWEPPEDKDEQVDALVCAFTSLFCPPGVQSHLMRGLLGLAKGSDTGNRATKLMKERDALSLLLPHLKPGMDAEVRRYAVQIFACLSSIAGEEALAALKEHSENFASIVEFLGNEGKSEADQVAAVAILAHLPIEDSFVTTALVQAECMPFLVKHLSSRRDVMQEEAAGALLRFTLPRHKDLQLNLAGRGAIQRFVSLLESPRTLTQERAATALDNFSQSSCRLSVRVTPRICWSCLSPQVQTCAIHKGVCETETTFCLKEANAMGNLLAVMKQGEPKAAEAAIRAVLTLVDDELASSEPGVHLLVRCKGVPSLINVLSDGSPTAQEMAATLTERIFRVVEYKKQYGGMLQMHIITVAQRGTPKARQIAGKILRQLELLHSQSHYFSQSVESTP